MIELFIQRHIALRLSCRRLQLQQLRQSIGRNRIQHRRVVIEHGDRARFRRGERADRVLAKRLKANDGGG